MKEIVQKENKVLRQVVKEISLDDISSDEVKNTIKDMEETLSSQSDGAALAAPQIGVSLSIFIISPIAYEESDNKFEEKHFVFINPKIIKKSLDRKLVEEGCLSVRPLYGKVRRSSRATIEAYDEEGNKFIMKGKGLMAQIFQHEIDHLQGVLFIDKAKDVHELPELMD